MGPILEDVAVELRGVVSVARVDVMDNRDIGTRFGIKGFPTIALFSHGHIYKFQGRRSVEEIVEFARGGYQLHEPEVVPKELGLFGEFNIVFRHAYTEATKDLLDGNYKTINIFCVALPVIFGVLLLLVLFVPLSSRNQRGSGTMDERRADNERRSEIPVSRRARQPTSATDSYSRKLDKEN